MQNTTQTAIAKSPAEARTLILSSAANSIELDFECTPSHYAEIASDSRKYDVSVLYRGQEMILVESFQALKRGLFTPKETFRQRHLVCLFNITLETAKEIAAVEARAAELGDLILPERVVTSPYTQWIH